MRNMGDRSDHARDAAIAIEIIEGERAERADQCSDCNSQWSRSSPVGFSTLPIPPAAKLQRFPGRVHWHCPLALISPWKHLLKIPHQTLLPANPPGVLRRSLPMLPPCPRQRQRIGGRSCTRSSSWRGTFAVVSPQPIAGDSVTHLRCFPPLPWPFKPSTAGPCWTVLAQNPLT